MKIAHLIAQFYPHIGGAEICIHNICNTMMNAGHEASVITTTAPPSCRPEVSYEIIYLWKRTCGLLRKVPFIGKIYLEDCLEELQEKHQFDIWQITMGYPLGVYAIDFFHKKKIPCILRCCGEDIQRIPEINYGYRLNNKINLLTKKTYTRYNGLVALTPTVKNEYLQMGIPEEKIKIIPNGADCSKFREIASNANSINKIKEKFGIGDKKLILTTGRYHIKKGFDFIPEIATKLKKMYKNFIWIIAGPGVNKLKDKFPECSDLNIICTEEFSAGDTDAFSLPPKSLIELYSVADIFVLPTLVETFGMVLVEAMAAGLPIVTTDALGVCDVIDNDYNGIKVPVKDHNAISEKIMKVLTDDKLSAKLSANALKTANEKYDWSIVTSSYMEFYKSLSNVKNV